MEGKTELKVACQMCSGAFRRLFVEPVVQQRRARAEYMYSPPITRRTPFVKETLMERTILVAFVSLLFRDNKRIRRPATNKKASPLYVILLSYIINPERAAAVAVK